MIKRSYVIAALVLYFTISASFVGASLLSPLISKLAPAAAAATGSGGAFTIPAKVLANTSTGANVAKWVSLAIPAATGAKIAITVAAVAGALASDYVIAKGALWFTANRYSKSDSGDWRQNNPVNVPDGFTYGNYEGPLQIAGQTNPYGMGIYNNLEAATAAYNAYRNGVSCSTGMSSYQGPYAGAKAVKAYCSSNTRMFFYPAAASVTHPEDRFTNKTPAEMEAALTADLANENANAKEVVKAGLDVAAASLDNPDHPVSKDAAAKATIAGALTGALTPDQLTNLEANATPNVGDNVLPDTDEAKVERLTPAQIAAAVKAALDGQGLSAAQIAAAVTAAQAAAGAGGLTQAQAQAAVSAALNAQGLSADQIESAINAVLPALGAYTGEFSAAAWSKPTVGNFSNLFSTFLNDMKATPLFSLPGLLSDSVPSGGSCEMSINLSERFGGSQSISICNWETGLSGMKAVLLCIASIFAVGIVAKGGS